MEDSTYPNIIFQMSPESWEIAFLDDDCNEIVYDTPQYVPFKLHWMTIHKGMQYSGFVVLDRRVLDDNYDFDIISAHKENIKRELKERLNPNKMDRY